MQTLSILLTNNALSTRAGSELYVRDVAEALLRRGHRPTAFSPVLGPFAEELRRKTVPVISDITRLAETPDVIHGHHHIETLIAALAFPDVPIVHFCHGWLPWEEAPLKHPSIRRYVAVDDVCVDRLVREEGIAPSRVDRLLNFVDLDRFLPRARLPPRARRALIFSNYATDGGYCQTIAAACAASDIVLDVVGHARGNASLTPETLLPSYDIVFAKGRAALEAMAVGCAVILADAVGCGALVTPQNFDRLRARNFGLRELCHPHDVQWYADQIAAVSSDGAEAVCDRVRMEAGLDAAVDRLLSIYARAMREPASEGDGFRAAAAHLQCIAVPFKERSGLSAHVQILSRELDLARREGDQLHPVRRERDDLANRVHELEEALKREETAHRALSSELDLARREGDQLHPVRRDRDDLANRVRELAEALKREETAHRALSSELDLARREGDQLHPVRRERDDLANRIRELEEALKREETAHGAEVTVLKSVAAALGGQVAAISALPTLRVRDAVLRVPVVGPVVQTTARRLARLLDH